MRYLEKVMRVLTTEGGIKIKNKKNKNIKYKNIKIKKIYFYRF